MTPLVETTGVLIIHNDSSLLTQTLESAKNLVDRLVVVDGAYQWVAPFCEMNGEKSDKSTDTLIEILDQSGLPYVYHTGVWQNETHKRRASLEFVETDRIMLIDSDEIYNVDDKKLQDFWLSGKVMASLQAPLFLHSDVVTWHTASGSYPLKPVFLNIKGQDIKTVVASLWLLLPDSEKGQILNRALVENVPLGLFYHLSIFRTHNNSYRRSRFYNLLSMRVGKRIGLDVNQGFESDEEFVSLVKQSNRTALDNMFNLDRIAAAFPQKKDNQDLVEFNFDNPAHQDIVEKAYKDMLTDQAARTVSLLGQRIEVFSGRGIFLDMTTLIAKGAKGFSIEHDADINSKTVWHIDCGTERFEVVTKNSDFPDLSSYVNMKRLIAEITATKPGQHTVAVILNIK